MNDRELMETFLTQQPLDRIPSFAETQRGGSDAETWELGEPL